MRPYVANDVNHELILPTRNRELTVKEIDSCKPNTWKYKSIGRDKYLPNQAEIALFQDFERQLENEFMSNNF